MRSVLNTRHTAQFIALMTLTFLVFGVAQADPIRIDSGQISGVVLDEATGMTVYRGIPFAAPPVDALRWKAPQPVKPWKGVRQCDTFSKVSPQGPRLALLMRIPMPETSEDCLYLNVWTTKSATNAKLPVMVWIHGGGLTAGWSHQPMYDGVPLASRNVVLVTINYRLGPLGFLAHPLLSKESPRGASGNYGILDQVAALKWVRRNIQKFGGDKNNVTIFGESAGGTSVHALMVSPLAKGVFHRAIAESAWVTDTNSVHLTQPTARRESGETDGEAFAAKLLSEGTEVTLEALRAASSDDILEAAGERYNVALTVDGYAFVEFPRETFANGRQHNVPFMAGTNKDEGTMFAPFLQVRNAADFERIVREEHGAGADAVLAHYKTKPKAALRESVVEYISDTWFIRPTREMLRDMEKVSSKAYMYHFTRTSQQLPGLGAHHAAEISYVFNTLSSDIAKEEDNTISEAMISHWVQFAKTGDPNDGTHLQWPVFDANSQQHMEFGDEIRLGENLRGATCDALDQAGQASREQDSKTD